MKRILCLLLCAVMAFGLLAGCGGEEGSAQTGATGSGFRVGICSVDITPTESVPLGGYGDSATRWSTGSGYPVNAVAMAFTDEDDKTVIYIALDLLLCYGFADTLREVISKQYELPKSQVMIHCDHSHSGPDMIFSDPSITNYAAQLTTSTLSAVETAMADRKPAEMYSAFARPERVNTVRHYLLADGNFQAEGVGAVEKNMLIGHATQADNLLQLVKFTREGGKDIIMMNWQGHPRGTDPSTIVTGNYYSVMRDYVNKALNCESIFVLSGSGNLNNNSQIPGEVKNEDYIELGQCLGEEVVKAAPSFSKLETGKILMTENLWVHPENNKTVPLYSLSFGDFAMVMAPFEIFDTNAVAVKESSKFHTTFFSSCSNKSMGYLPTPMSFDWEIAYEVRITNFPKGTAELVQEQLQNMLEAQFQQSGNEIKEKPEIVYQKPFEPATDGKTYTNPDPGNTSNYKAVNNGFFAIQLLDGANIKNILTRDEDTAKKVLEQTSMQLIFDVQGVVVGVVE